MNFVVAATELGNERYMEQDISLVCNRLLRELTGDLMGKAPACFAPFPGRLVYVRLTGYRTLWREAVWCSGYEHGLWQQDSNHLDSNHLSYLRAGLTWSSYLTFQCLFPPSVYEDGGDKSASGVSVSTRNVLTYCKAFTAVPTPKVSLRALSISRHRRDLSVLPPQFYKCGTETFKILPSEFFN